MKKLFLLSIVSLFVLISANINLTPLARTHGPRIKVKNGQSTNWSGYAVETNLSNPQNNAVSNVQGSWVVPAVDCSGSTSNKYSSAWVGIDGYSDGSVEQTGTEHDCINGSAQYYAWYEMYPKFGYKVPLTVHAGDTISASVKYLSNGKFQLTLQSSNGQSFSTTQKSARAGRQSAEWVVEAPSSSGGVLPLANFGTTSFSSAQATLNNVVGNVQSFANDRIDMVTSGGTVIKAQTSSLQNSGTAFSVTWLHE